MCFYRVIIELNVFLQGNHGTKCVFTGLSWNLMRFYRVIMELNVFLQGNHGTECVFTG